MKFFRITFLFFLALAAMAGGAVWRLWEVIFPDGGGVWIYPTDSTVSSDTAVSTVNFRVDSVLRTVNVLLIGVDDVDGSRRADAIVLAVFDIFDKDKDAKSIRIMSIPRDSHVLIPGYSWDKINHAYAYGGTELLKNTVTNLLGVGVGYFVVVNYDGFARIIDLLGGIDVDVEKAMVYTDYAGKLFINIPKGRQHMDGRRSLEYARFRHDPLGDIGRIQRQQKVLGIIMEQLKSPVILPKIKSLIDEATAAVNTDLTPVEALRLAQLANSLPAESIQLSMAPGKTGYVDGLSYWFVDVRAAPAWLAGEAESADLPVFPEDPAPPLDSDALRHLISQIGKVGILNGRGAGGLSKQAAQIFQGLGVDVVYTGNAKHFDYRSTNIIYPENATEKDKQSADALATLCGITNRALVQRNRAAQMVCIILGHDSDIVFQRLQNTER